MDAIVNVGRNKSCRFGEWQLIKETSLSSASVFHQLMAVIEDRRDNPPERSYTTSLFVGGIEKIGEKILEESREVIDAAAETDEKAHSHTVHEAADLLYHLFVLLGHKHIEIGEVEAELARRFGISGLDEKAGRNA